MKSKILPVIRSTIGFLSRIFGFVSSIPIIESGSGKIYFSIISLTFSGGIFSPRQSFSKASRKVLREISVLVIFYLATVAIFCTVGISQTSDGETTRRKAEAEARTAEARARAAEAQARTAEAGSRTSEIENRKAELELLAAQTTVEGELIENDISAYKAVACAASDINQQIRNVSSRIDLLMLYEPRFAKTMTEYAVLISQLERLKVKYDEAFRSVPEALRIASSNTDPIPSKSIDSILSPAKQISSLAIDTMALFKTDVSIKGSTVVIGQDEFIAKLLNGVSIDVYYPDKFVPINIGNSSKLLNLVTDLAELRVKADYIALNKLSVSEPDRKRVAPKLEALNAIYDSIISQFFPPAADDEKGDGETDGRDDSRKQANYRVPRSTIVDFMRAEAASDIMGANDERRKYWLDVHVTKAGSNQRNKSSAVLDIFTGGQRLSFSGGSIVNYRIFNSSGLVIASDTILTYIPYKRSKEIADFRCQTVSFLP